MRKKKMKNVRLTICLMAAVLVIAASLGFGDIYFNDGGTHNINYTINERLWVDYSTPSMQTTVNLLDGGQMLQQYQIDGYNDSRLNISGGSWWDLYAHNRCQVTMSGGTVGNNGLMAFDNSQITMSGGTARHGLYAHNESQITMSGGEAQHNFTAYENSQITMSGGTADCMEASGNSQAIMSGGTVVGSLFVRDSSQLTMSGGTVGYLFSDGGQTTMSGGRLSETLGIRLDTGAELIIEGSNFAIDGTLFGFGEITSILGGGYTLEPYRRITGTLSNGDVLNTQFQIGRNASITLVPEPCTLLLLGLGAVMLRRKF